MTLSSHKKKIIFFSSLSVALFIFLFSPVSAHAAWYDFLIGAVTFIPAVAVALIGWLSVSIISIFTAFAGVVLKWVISPTFVQLSYTRPGFNTAAGENPIIATGLSVTQGFVNMILVLILIYIALATILRLAGYETKKLLVTFVIVALLVNFAPVICGLIVDASNIMMNYFVKDLSGGQQLVNSLTSIVDVAKAGFDWKVFKATTQISLLSYLFMLAWFNFFLMLALFLFAAIFLIRYIAIWILVILSPLAFACYILPATKKYWTLWWSQFLQWSFIGAIAGFFLYLGEQIAALSPSIFVPPSGELGSAILPYLVPLAFLYLGLMVGFSTSAMGASAVMGLTKKGGKWVRGKGGGAIWHRAEEKGHVREAAGKAVQAVERVPVVRAFIPDAARKYAQFRPAIDEAQSKGKFQSSPELAHRMATGADYGVNAVGNMMEIIDRGDSSDIFTAFKGKYFKDRKPEDVSDEELYKVKEFKEKMGRWLQIGFRGGRHNTILRSTPRLARLAPEAKIKGYEGLSEEAAVSKAVSEARGQHIKNWEVEELKDETVIKAGLSRGRDFWQSVSGQIKRGHEEPLQTIANVFKKSPHYKPGMSDRQLDEAWENFHQDIKTKNNGQEGFFLFLDSKRAEEQGWSDKRIKEIVTEKYVAPKTPTTPTPGAAAGITMKDIGRAAAKKRKEPDTGKS